MLQVKQTPIIDFTTSCLQSLPQLFTVYATGLRKLSVFLWYPKGSRFVTPHSYSVRPLVSLIAAHNVFLSPNKTKIIGITTEQFFHPWRTYPMCALTTYACFPSSEHENSIAQPNTDKWPSSPSHFSSSTVPKS